MIDPPPDRSPSRDDSRGGRPSAVNAASSRLSRREVSIVAIRERAQHDLIEPPLYRVIRWLSPYASLAALRAGLSPNLVTLTWVCMLIASSVAFALGTPAMARIGSLLILVYLILDCADGEVARMRNRASVIGSQIEQVSHWVTNGVVLLGVCLGARAHTRPGMLLVTLGLALVGDYSFHFVYYQLNLMFRREVDYGALHKVTRILYNLMPINTNLIMIGGLGHLEFEAVVVWAIASNLLWPSVMYLYLRVERRLPAR